MTFHFFHLKFAFTALPIWLATSNPNSYSRSTLPVPFYHSDIWICTHHIHLYQGRLPVPVHQYVLMYWMVLTLQLLWFHLPLTLSLWTNSRNLLFVRSNMTPSQVLSTILLFQSVWSRSFPIHPPYCRLTRIPHTPRRKPTAGSWKSSRNERKIRI